ncbi:hypothetical protein KV01_002498 [Salmonella enterica subsp. enterica]|nr:hypothetical protein [Salmonella enterica subsp. enterica]HAF1584742.1 hypothetical protein [Salmonella enterica]
MKIAEIQVHDVIWHDNDNGKEIGARVTFFGPDERSCIVSVPVSLPHQLDLTIRQVEELAITTAKEKLKLIASSI